MFALDAMAKSSIFSLHNFPIPNINTTWTAYKTILKPIKGAIAGVNKALYTEPLRFPIAAKKSVNNNLPSKSLAGNNGNNDDGNKVATTTDMMVEIVIAGANDII